MNKRTFLKLAAFLPFVSIGGLSCVSKPKYQYTPLYWEKSKRNWIDWGFERYTSTEYCFMGWQIDGDMEFFGGKAIYWKDSLPADFKGNFILVDDIVLGFLSNKFYSTKELDDFREAHYPKEVTKHQNVRTGRIWYAKQ